MTEAAERQRYITAAKGYIGTPYHHMGMIKGAGVDCATLLICAARDAGLPGGDCVLDYYAPHWHLHRNSQKYLSIIHRFCKPVDYWPPRPGDIVLWQFGRSYSHSAIVIDWPTIIHAYVGRPVGIEDADRNMKLQFIIEDRDASKPRPRMVVSHWG